MAGPQNAIIGDDYGIDLPMSEVDNTQVAEEQKAAKYSKSHEYKKLRQHWEERIKHYQTYLPNGKAVGEVDTMEAANSWIIANTIIAELQYVMNYYDNAREVVEKHVV